MHSIHQLLYNNAMPVDTTTATTFGFEAEAVSVPAITGELNLDSSESQSGRGNAPEKGAGLCTHWKKVPFFNLIGFLFLSAKPHGYKEISSILVNIGLISALLFTIVGAIPLSITAEEVYANDNYHGPVIPGITELELNAIVQRAITEPGSVEIGRAGCIRHGNFLMEPYSFEMWHNYITSVHLLGITLVLSVFMNLSLVALHGDKKEDFDGPFAPILRRWWDYTKYAIGLVVIILLISIVLAFRTLHYVAHVRPITSSCQVYDRMFSAYIANTARTPNSLCRLLLSDKHFFVHL